MKIIRRRELGIAGASILLFSIMFLPTIAGEIFFGQKGSNIGFAVSLILWAIIIGFNILDKRWTYKIAATAGIHSIDYEMKIVKFEFNKEIVSLRLPACDRFFMQYRKLGEIIPVQVTVGKITRTIQEIKPIM